MKFNIRIKKINLKKCYNKIIDYITNSKKECWIFCLLFVLLLWNICQQCNLLKLQKELNYSCSSYELQSLENKVNDNTRKIEELSNKIEEINSNITKLKHDVENIENDIYHLNRYSHTHTYY